MPRNELLIDIRVNVLGWSQAKLARMVGVSTRTVRGWESGKTARPQPAVLVQLMKVTGVASAAELGFSAAPSSRGRVRIGGSGQKGSDDVLNRRNLLMIVSAAMGGALAEPVSGLFPAPKDRIHIGATDVAALWDAQIKANEFQRAMGGGAINGAAMVRRFRAGLDALHGVYRDESVRQEMHEAVAHFGNIAAWIMIEHGEHGTAQRARAAALAAADGAPPDRRDGLRALILTGMARQAIYQQHYGTAVALLDYLDSLLPELPADVRAIVRTRRARALAGLGEAYQVDELGQRAVDEFCASAPTSAALFKTQDFAIDELASDLGHAFSTLAVEHGIRSAEAERRLTESIAAYGLGDPRSRAMAGVQLVSVHLAQRDGRRALAVAQAHAADAALIKSYQLHRTAEAGLALAVRHRSDPGMAEVIDILRNIRRPIDVRAQTA